MRPRLLLMLGLLVLACTEETTQPVVREFPPLEAGRVRVNIVAEPQGGGIVRVEVMIDAESLEVGAYQGRFRYDPGELELREVRVPEGDYRFVNAEGAKRGEIRFAGFTVAEFESPVAVELEFREVGVLELEDLTAELEVVGDVLGEEVGRGKIMEPAKLIAR